MHGRQWTHAGFFNCLTGAAFAPKAEKIAIPDLTHQKFYLTLVFL